MDIRSIFGDQGKVIMVMIKQQFDYMYIGVRIEIIWPTLIGIDFTDISNYAYSEVNSKVPRTSL